MFDWGKYCTFAVWKEQETPFPNPFPVEGQGSRKSKKVSLRKGVRCWRSRFPIKGHERKRVIGVRCWVLGDGGHLGCEKSLPTQGDLEGLFYLRFNSVPSPFQVRSLKWDLHGSHLGGT